VAKDDTNLSLLLQATNRLAYPKWDLSGDVAFSTRKAAFTTKILESSHDVEGFRLRCEDGTGNLRRLSGGPWGRVSSRLSAASPDGSWQLSGGHVTEYNIGRSGNTATVAFHDYTEVRQGTPAATVVVYSSAPSAAVGWLPVRRSTAVDDIQPLGLQCRVFGRDALIRPVDVPEFGAHGGTIAIAWIGGPFRGSALRVLITVLSFVFGTFLEQAMRCTVDANGDVLEQTLYALHSPHPIKPRPPIHLYHPADLRNIADQLGTMLRRCRSLFVQDVPLDVAVAHLLPPHDTVGDEIRDIALALDTLIESPLYEPPRRPLVSRRRFQAIKAQIETFAATILTEDEGEVKSRIGQVLVQANSASGRDRRKKFWHSVGMEPTPQELAALEHRDTVSHRGFIPFAHGRDSEWNRIIGEKGLLRTLVNRVIFRLLGYDGPVLNYASGRDVTIDGAPLPGQNVSRGANRTQGARSRVVALKPSRPKQH
jgi:hypothetical protein